jgi:flavin-dependent dehydrogenase
VDAPRPAKFEGQRTMTAFQVDRALYDKILLDHARELGCMVKEECRVKKVEVESNSVQALELDSGEAVTAKYYVDASGNSGILRRALQIPCEYPTSLKNIAIYDYWQNADWAVRIGVGGTRIQVLTVGFGWIWFIPLGPTRTSIGLIVPASHMKESGKTAEELYLEAVATEPIVSGLLKNATREKILQTTRDWSFLAKNHAGSNWFLVGECAGFADPILSAGVTMAHLAAQQLTYTILELERGQLEPQWLKESYTARQSQRIRTHIRFADYWYTSNQQFKDLIHFSQSLASDRGLEMSPEAAWAWLAQGGFIDEDLRCGVGGFSLGSIRAMDDKLADLNAELPFERFNHFELDLSGATYHERARYASGRVLQTAGYGRGDKVLPIDGAFEILVNILQHTADLDEILTGLQYAVGKAFVSEELRLKAVKNAMQILDAMIVDGWVKCSFDPSRPLHSINYEDRPVRWQRAAEASPA